MKTLISRLSLMVIPTVLLGGELSERSEAFANAFSLTVNQTGQGSVALSPSFLNATNPIALGAWNLSPPEPSMTQVELGLNSSPVYSFSAVGTNELQRVLGSISVENSPVDTRINALNSVTAGNMDIEDLCGLSLVETNQTGFSISVFPIGRSPTNPTARPESVIRVRSNAWLELTTDADVDIRELSISVINLILVDE